MNYLHIEYANPRDLADSITIRYQLKQHSVVERWVERVLLAQQQYTIDDPKRFYGFGTIEEQTQDALERINHCITLIKLQHPEISVGHLTDVHDQDRLNYFHNIFERSIFKIFTLKYVHNGFSVLFVLNNGLKKSLLK